MEAINSFLNDIVKNPKVFILRIPTHMNLSKNYYEVIKNSKLKIVCGTNLFHLNYLPISKFNSWKISIKEVNILDNVLLFGVGTNIYSNNPTGFKRKINRKIATTFANPYSRFMWKKILTKDGNLYHSVRDEESADILKGLGFNNALNTGCPTIWKLDEAHCSCIPKVKSESVVVTFTDYRKNLTADKKMLRIVTNYYRNIYIWPQGSGDYDYIKQLLNLTQIDAKVLPATLKAFDDLLSYNNVDYIGTRLHGGIRALQHKKRAIIIAVDNRAISFKRDFNLPIIERDEIGEELERKIIEPYFVNIKIRRNDIELFKNSLEAYINI